MKTKPNSFIPKKYQVILVKFAANIFLYRDSECFYITNRSCSPYQSLASNQEEADKKVILHNLDMLYNSDL